MCAVLSQEHLLLGGILVPDDHGVEVPRQYGPREHELAAFDEGVALCDLSGMTARLMSGAPAVAFAQSAFAGRVLAVGETAFEAVLTGEGRVVSTPLLMRTGDAEYVCWDLSSRADTLVGWLEFLAAIEQNGAKPFDGLALEDVGDAFVPLLLWGPAAANVLADYVGNQKLPSAGTVANIMLDRIGCIVACVRIGNESCYLVLVPPRAARILWRSFLSFTVVAPVGRDALAERMTSAFAPLGAVHGQDDVVELDAAELRRHGLVRSDATFVGARGLGA